MECIVCNQVFEAKRADARYCSAKCRVTANRNKDAVTDNSVTDKLPANYGLDDCQCKHCQQACSRGAQGSIINHGQWKPIGELQPKEVNRVALPGDVDYRGAYV